jgi:hypothetical protein
VRRIVWQYQRGFGGSYGLESYRVQQRIIQLRRHRFTGGHDPRVRVRPLRRAQDWLRRLPGLGHGARAVPDRRCRLLVPVGARD